MHPPLPHLLLAGLLACPASHALTCEELRASIEARVALTGASQFSVTTVDAGAAAQGRVVGTCERGSRKIVYWQQPGATGAAPAPAPAARDSAILTECRDGSVSMGGRCRP